jgi:hypothetical protein
MKKKLLVVVLALSALLVYGESMRDFVYPNGTEDATSFESRVFRYLNAEMLADAARDGMDEDDVKSSVIMVLAQSEPFKMTVSDYSSFVYWVRRAADIYARHLVRDGLPEYMARYEADKAITVYGAYWYSYQLEG